MKKTKGSEGGQIYKNPVWDEKVAVSAELYEKGLSRRFENCRYRKVRRNFSFVARIEIWTESERKREPSDR